MQLKVVCYVCFRNPEYCFLFHYVILCQFATSLVSFAGHGPQKYAAWLFQYNGCLRFVVLLNCRARKQLDYSRMNLKMTEFNTCKETFPY